VLAMQPFGLSDTAEQMFLVCLQSPVHAAPRGISIKTQRLAV
jgi:hypothetical protein